MLSNKPYLIRAFYEWIVDNNCTPNVVINTTYPKCYVPEKFIQNDEIVFNISPLAVRDLKITNEKIDFSASFSGVVHLVSAPVKAILAIYAEENGQGMYFDYEEEGGGDYALASQGENLQQPANPSKQDPKKGLHLKLVE